MQKFSQYSGYEHFNESVFLMEKLITFGGKAYPKYGNVVIMAGGGGSGKGFIIKNLLGLEGKQFDVDAFKTLAAKSPLIQKRVKEEFGDDLLSLSKNLKNPDNTARLHDIFERLNLPDRKDQLLYTQIMLTPEETKPNLIYDSTLKSLEKFGSITRTVKNLGYKPENIHVVWVINEVEVALAQNQKRSRRVPAEIIINAHRNVSQTLNDIVQMGEELKKYMDGDIVFAFNKVGVDVKLTKSETSKGKYVKDANYFYVKKAGKSVLGIDQISKDIREKIKDYVPKNVEWV